MTAYRFSLYRVLTSAVFVSDSNDASCRFDETNSDKETKRMGDEETILIMK